MNILITVAIPGIGGEMKENVHQVTEGAVMTGMSPLQSDRVLMRKMIAPGLGGQRETEHSSLNALIFVLAVHYSTCTMVQYGLEK